MESSVFKSLMGSFKKGEKPNQFRGRYIPKNPEKYLGDSSRIIFRSAWERLFMVFCDKHPSVKKWGSETVKVSYEYKDKHRVYYPDFFICTLGDDDKFHSYLVEIKPSFQAFFPMNKAKWKAARAWCESQEVENFEFKVITEKELYGSS